MATSRGQESNLALGKPVVASAATYAGQIPENLTDGQFNNQSHPLTATGTIGFYYRIDLGKDEALSRIIMYNRTGCCPERLSNYRVALLADNGGSPGAANWTADIRTDNSHSGDGGTDILTPDLDPSGEFRGRYIHIENLSNAAYNPQIAEVEAYPAQLADIRFFTTDAGNITATGDPDLPAQATLSWQVDDYESLEITPDIGAVSGPAGTRVVMPAATTTYTLRATNEGGTITQTVTIGVDAPFAPPLITEFAAENAGSILDEDGDKSDWIEIYNPNGYHLPLSGFYLTDNPDNLSKWAVGGLAIPPGGYSVVFASEKDRADPAGELHTNFRLSRGGEYVALVAPDGLTVLSQFPADFPDTAEFPPQKAGASYGIASGGGAAFLSPPTPGTANGGGFSGFVADTQFSVDRGFYTDPIQVEVTTATPGAEIRYTTDGSAPTAATGTVYGGPISVGSTTVLRAAAFLPGYIPTNIDTHTYIFVADVAQNPVLAASIRQDPTYGPQIPAALLSLPSLSITTPSAINGNTEVGCSLEMVFPDGTPGFQEDCGVKNYGGAFTNFPKKNFRLYFRGEYGATKLDYPLFAGHERDVSAPGRFDALELRSGSHDMKMRGFYMANRFCDDTMLDMGDVNPHGRFVHLYINGTYWGQYHLRERFNAAMFASYLGGSKEDYEAINGNWNVGGWADPGTPYDGTGSVWENTKALALSASPDNYPATLPWLNMQSLVDFMAVFMYGYAEHEYRTVAPRARQRLEFYQNDADGFFGTAFGGTRNPTEFCQPGARRFRAHLGGRSRQPLQPLV
ncbi:MAG: chitobiase/beta-hexosaminidase C-terminal domain-containing protein [Verrucomicrobiales bacterium]